VKRLLKLGVAVFVLRWAAGEAASYAGRHWRAPGPAPLDSPRAPGWMPGPDRGPDSGIKKP
jgi:hypothetical protein